MTEEPYLLLDKARTAFRAGRLKETEALLQQAVARQPGLAAAHALLSKIARNRNDIPAAEQHARQAVEANPMEPGAHDALIAVLLLSQDPEALLEEYRQAVVAWPDDFSAIYGLGALLFNVGRAGESVVWLQRALELAPESFPVEFKLARAFFGGGNYKDALSTIGNMQNRGADGASIHEFAGHILLDINRPEHAVKAYRRALDKNPDEHSYHAGLSTALHRAGRLEDAVAVTQNFLERVPAYTQTARNPEARVLVIGTVGMFDRLAKPTQDRTRIFKKGNTPSQLPNDRNTYHFTHIQHPDLLKVAGSLGPIDLVINNLGCAETSIEKGHGLKVREIVDKLGVPVVNAPEAVERTTRAANAQIIPENTDIIFPRTVLCDLSAEGPEKVKRRILESVRFPMLIRHSQTNEDPNIAFAADEGGLTEALAHYHMQDFEKIYAIEFQTQDFRPGIFRKIRCAIIDNVVYPVRVDFSTHWNVRRKELDSATAKANQELMDSELAYLEDPVSYLGPRNIARLEALGRLHDLDFLGVDFNIIGDGEMFVFEANPAMNCIERRRVKEFPYFAGYWEKVLVAFEDMIVKKAGNR